MSTPATGPVDGDDLDGATTSAAADSAASTAASTSAQEVERKYAVSADGIPECADLGPAAPPRVDTLVAIYYDTPALDLLAAKITLRRRTGGLDAGWHLKTPGTDDARTEMRVPLSAGRRIPLALRDAVADLVGERPLLPIVRMENERTTTELLDADGAPKAELCEDRVIATVLRSDAAAQERWEEVEVELAPGVPHAVLDEIEPKLLDAGLTVSTSASKLARVLADVPPKPDPHLDDPAGDVVAAALADHFGRLQALEGAVRGDEPDAVHQARVTLRRMRSLLQVFGKVFEPGDARALRDELRWAGERLGEPRDAEVIRDELGALVDGLEASQVHGPIGDRIRSTLDARHDRAFARCLVALDSARWDAMFVQISEFLDEVPLTRRGQRPAGRVLPKLTGKAEGKVAKRLKRAERHPGDLDGWHEVRKAAKGARYAYEALAAVEVDGADDDRKRWKQVASAFGEVQDSVILEEQLEVFERDATAAGEPLDTYELLRGRLLDGREQSLTTAIDAVTDALDA